MTKLNVVIPAVNVMVDGVTYRKVDRKAQAGDIVKATAVRLDITEGAFYGPAYVNISGALTVRDDADDDHEAFITAGTYEVYEALTEVTAEITYDNAKYRKIDRSAREGDIIVFTDEGGLSDRLTLGKRYGVTEIDWAGDPQITDDDGDEYDACGDTFDVYEKVSVEPAQTYREVSRKAAVGERIKIVNAEIACGYYGNGTELTVTEVSRGISGSTDHVKTAEVSIAIFDTEYVVLEPVTTGTIAEPARLTVGDYAKVIGGDNGRSRVGDIVKITEDDRTSLPYRCAHLDGSNAGWKHAHRVAPATAEEVSAAQAQAQRKLAIGPFADGGFAVVADASNSHLLRKSPNGTHVVVTVTDPEPYALELTHSDGEYGGFCNADALRQITEAEYNAAIAPKPKFSVGDKIRITESQHNWSVGTIATITKVLTPATGRSHGTVLAVALGDTYLADTNCFDVLTVEEIAAIEKEAQEIAKWAKIGRKVGEFKRGDIVSFVKTSGEKGVGTVEDGGCNPSAIGVRMGAKVWDGSAFYGVFFREGDSATLITPVEQRFDTEATAA